MVQAVAAGLMGGWPTHSLVKGQEGVHGDSAEATLALQPLRLLVSARAVATAASRRRQLGQESVSE